jgi:hypothetical protein
MGVNGGLFLGQSSGRIPHLSAPAANVPGERSFLHPAMNPSLFESLESSCLSVRKPGLGATFGENPAPFARPDQQEFNVTVAHSIAYCGHLVALLEFAQFRQPHKPGR